MKGHGLKIFAAWLLLLAVLLSGCSQSSGTEPQGMDPQKDREEETREQSFGRYLERAIELPEEWELASDYPHTVLQTMENGDLALLDETVGLYTSADQGDTWEPQTASWLTSLKERDYIQEMALSPDGGAAVIYTDREADGNEDGDEDTGDSAYEYNPKYFYADASGESFEFSGPDQENYLHRIAFGRDGRLYGFSLNGKAYEIIPSEDSFKPLFTTDGLADYICFTEKYMVVTASGGISVYDLGIGSLTEDLVLEDFITEQAGNNIGNNTGSYVVVTAAGAGEDVLYLAMESGLYRHVIGGAAVEQIADGSVNSLGDPQMYLLGMEVLSEDEFVILYTGPQLCRYTYDPNVPTVPEEQISVYSLKESYAIRQAVSLFQKQNPDVYIRYEVGMSGSDALTAEDAVKNLNTKLLSGKGPDILVLDGLPADSYKEKGILADLTELEAGMTGDNSLFPNLVEAFREDGKLYSMPVRFRIPIAVGEVEGVSDLASFADTVERMREENPKGAITRLVDEAQTIYTLGLACSPAWLDKDGEIDREALTEFLNAAKRVHQAEIAGYTQQELTEMQERFNGMWDLGLSTELYSADTSFYAMDIAMDEMRLGLGTIEGINSGFTMVSTVAAQEEDVDYTLYEGQTPKSFVPEACVGICMDSAENGQVRAFFSSLFGRELQDLEGLGGFPVNRASFEGLREDPYGEGEGASLSVGGSDGSGERFSLELKWPDEEQFDRLKGIVESLSQPSDNDSVIAKTVREIGTEALNGKLSVEDTVEEIVKKSAIYLAE